MSTGMNRRSSRTYASRLDDEWQLDTNWTAKPTWKVEQIFFAFLSFIDTCHDISTVFALLQGGFLFQVLFDWWNWVCCCCQAKSHVFAMIKILAMTIRSILLLRDYFYPGKKYKKWARGTRKWQLSTLIRTITVSHCLKINQKCLTWHFPLFFVLLKLTFWPFDRFWHFEWT